MTTRRLVEPGVQLAAVVLLFACGPAGPGGPGETGGPVGGPGPLPSPGMPSGDTTIDHVSPFGDSSEPVTASPLVEPNKAFFIHVGGMCSQRFSGGKGGGGLANFDDRVNVDAEVDQRDSMSVAVPQMRAVLDTYCTDDSWCNVYTYSNGGAVVSKTLSIYDSSRWNILWVLSAASNEGGSELSGSFTATLGDTLGISCNISNNMSPSDHRAGWNHNDTGGTTFYLVGGYDEWWYTGSFPDFFDGMANDGAVPYHSSAGMNDTYFVSDDDPWLCYKPEYHYENHSIAWACKGQDADHNVMKNKGIELLGG